MFGLYGDVVCSGKRFRSVAVGMRRTRMLVGQRYRERAAGCVAAGMFAAAMATARQRRSAVAITREANGETRRIEEEKGEEEGRRGRERRGKTDEEEQR